MTNENERNRYIGLMGACIGMGFIVGPAIGGMLSHFGNAVPFQIASNLLLILFLYTCFTFKESLNNAEEKHAENPLKIHSFTSCINWIIFHYLHNFYGISWIRRHLSTIW